MRAEEERSILVMQAQSRELVPEEKRSQKFPPAIDVNEEALKGSGTTPRGRDAPFSSPRVAPVPTIPTPTNVDDGRRRQQQQQGQMLQHQPSMPQPPTPAMEEDEHDLLRKASSGERKMREMMEVRVDPLMAPKESRKARNERLDPTQILQERIRGGRSGERSGGRGSDGRQSTMTEDELEATLRWLSTPRSLIMIDRNSETLFEFAVVDGRQDEGWNHSFVLRWGIPNELSSIGYISLKDVKDIALSTTDSLVFSLSLLPRRPQALRNSGGRTKITIRCNTVAESAKYKIGLESLMEAS
jgi:hypothetical protein